MGLSNCKINYIVIVIIYCYQTGISKVYYLITRDTQILSQLAGA